MDDQRSRGDAQEDRSPRVARDAQVAADEHMLQTPLEGALILSRAVAQLRVGGDPGAADLLASCTLVVEADALGDLGLVLVGPLTRHLGPLDLEHPLVATLASALRAALPAGVWVERLWARPAGDLAPGAQQDDPLPTVTIPDGPGGSLPTTSAVAPPRGSAAWTEAPDETGGLNQAAGELAPRVWAGMRFRSESELRIAQALDRAGVLFFPGALARVGAPGERHSREVDFLICWQGKWGMLEVDGAPFHGPDRALADAARDQRFHAQGVKMIVRADALRCYAAPDAVVTEFLTTLQAL